MRLEKWFEVSTQRDLQAVLRSSDVILRCMENHSGVIEAPSAMILVEDG